MPLHTNPHLARCPHCDSAFEVSPEELEMALGAVRCGECMKIFNAHFHRIDPLAPAQQDSEEPESPSSQDPIPTLHEHYHQPEIAELPFDDPGEEWLDEELLAFETELETALTDPEGEQAQLPEISLDADELEQEDADSFQEEMATEAREPHRDKGRHQLGWQQLFHEYKKHLIALSITSVIIFSTLGTWLLLPEATLDHFAIHEIRISPASSPQKMQIHFQLSNQGKETTALPDLQVELLNLSRQVIATQRVAASDIPTDIRQLEAASSQTLQVEVERPSTYVQHARIIPLTP